MGWLVTRAGGGDLLGTAGDTGWWWCDPLGTAGDTGVMVGTRWGWLVTWEW